MVTSVMRYTIVIQCIEGEKGNDNEFRKIKMDFN